MPEPTSTEKGMIEVAVAAVAGLGAYLLTKRAPAECPGCDSCCPTPPGCSSCCPTPPACDSCCPDCPTCPTPPACDSCCPPNGLDPRAACSAAIKTYAYDCSVLGGTANYEFDADGFRIVPATCTHTASPVIADQACCYCTPEMITGYQNNCLMAGGNPVTGGFQGPGGLCYVVRCDDKLPDGNVLPPMTYCPSV